MHYKTVQIVIRRAQAHDTDAVCTVLRRSILECCVQDHQNNQIILEDWLANKTPENVRSWIASKECAFFVAEREQTVVGVANLKVNGTILLLYLLPEARFLGVGRALLTTMEDHARYLNLTSLTLDSTATAHSFYLKHGFTDEGIDLSFHQMPSYKMRKVLDL